MAITTITNAMVSVNAIQGTLIADNAITAVHIATNAVSGTLIADNAVTATHIAQNVITVTQLADDAVEADKIADGVITTNHLNKAMISSQTEVTAVGGDYVLIGDTSDSNNLKKALVSDFGESNRLPLAGGTLTGDLILGDGIKLELGAATGGDAQLFHSGSHAQFVNATGDTYIQNDSIVYITNADTSKNSAAFDTDGAVTLYYNNSAKLTTTSYGLEVKDTGGIELRLEADSNNSGQEDCFIRFYTDGKTQEGIAGMDNNNSSTLFTGNTENAMVFGTVSNLPTIFATNNTERLHITSGGDVSIKVGKKFSLSADEDTYFMEYSANEIGVYTGGTVRAKWSGGNYLPGADNSYDLGGIGSRWRNLYTTDLHMSNENGGNKVDGTWGNYTIQEGEDELYLINHRNGKSYKFNLTEVTPSVSGDLDSSLPGA